MADTTLQQVQAGQALRTVKERQLWLVRALLIGGLFVVVCAMPLGQSLAPRTEIAPGNYQWNPDGVSEITLILRILGVMAFAAGLAERVVYSIKYDRVMPVD